MNEELVAELGQSLLHTVEAITATSDMLALLCIHFAKASPGPASALLATLQKMSESAEIEKTQSFVAMSSRLQQALSGDLDLQFLSLKKTSAAPTTPEELRSRLRLIRGGAE